MNHPPAMLFRIVKISMELSECVKLLHQPPVHNPNVSQNRAPLFFPLWGSIYVLPFPGFSRFGFFAHSSSFTTMALATYL